MTAFQGIGRVSEFVTSTMAEQPNGSSPMGEVEEKIGADYLPLLAAKQRLSVLNSEVKKMTGNLNMAISLLNGEETGHYAYRVHNRPHSRRFAQTIDVADRRRAEQDRRVSKAGQGRGRCPEQTVQGDRGEALVLRLTNTVMKLRGHFGRRQGAMTCRGDRRSPPSGGHHASKSNAADGQKDPQIRNRICETPHCETPHYGLPRDEGSGQGQN